MSAVPRTPWNGLWNGNGIISNSFPGEFTGANVPSTIDGFPYPELDHVYDFEK